MPVSPEALPADASPAAPAPRPRTGGHPGTSYPGTWIDSVEVRLAGDRDGDGYHSSLAVTLDVDTEHGFAEVYASVALVDGYGGVAAAHDTSAFGVEGRARWDATTVEFELLDDFPSDRYDLYVEVRDAYRGDALDGVGANEFASLASFRLEGTRRDGYGHGTEIGFGVGFSSGYSTGYSSYGGYYGGPRDDYYSSSYGAVSYAGAADPFGLAALAGGVALALLARRGVANG